MTILPDADTIRRGMDLAGDPASTRVVVAMSGGVDSSVVAGLLKHAGYDVVGITLQLYDHGEAVARSGSCCAGQDIHDARRVAEELDFPHYVLDYEDRFREAVISTFADSYVAGETPIPCVSCNQSVKFKDLLATARDLGAHALATGHYIRSERGKSGFDLWRPQDAARDQSYFLFATTREQLDFLRFPLGAFTKAQVRGFASHMGLGVAEKSDSQDICFVPSGRYSAVVEKLRPGAVEPGEIVHLDGRVLGRHAGIINFTVGQRRGIGIASTEPLFVVRLNADRQQVIVGPRAALRTAEIWLREVNWLGGGDLQDDAGQGIELFVRVRSTRPPQPATLYGEANDTARIVLHDGDDGVSPGQACVFYSAGEGAAQVLGGGFIERTQAAHEVKLPQAAPHREVAAG